MDQTDDLDQLRGDLGIVGGVRLGETDHGTGDGRLGVLQHPGAGDARRLVGRALRPEAAELAALNEWALCIVKLLVTVLVCVGFGMLVLVVGG
ncbi:hypothetical protein GTY82_33190 [Streptomyces sp. SID5476]|nr:hypothetical protein [Streptomyces sp. SID5476]